MPDEFTLSQAAFGAPGNPGNIDHRQSTRETTCSAADGPIPLVYGQQRVGGRLFYASSYQGTLILGFALCEGPVYSLTAANVTLDGNTLTTCVTKGWIKYDLHDGAYAQTVSPILALAGYTQTHPGLSYLALRIFGKAPWSALPSVLAIIQGLLVYDPRDTNTKYSDNPALIARDLMTRLGTLVTADFDDTSVDDAATYFDATIDSEKRYTLCLAITTESTLQAWLQNVQAHCGMEIYPDQGVYVFAPDKTLSSPVALTDGHLKNVVIQRKSSVDTPTRVTVEWTNPTKDYITDTATAETAEVAAGTEDPVTGSHPCPGITSAKMAQRHALYLLRRENFASLMISAVVSPMAEQLRRGDYVTITNRGTPYGKSSPTYRLNAQGAIVKEVQPVGDGSFAVTFEEYDANAYSTSTYTTDTPPSTTLPDPFAAPADVDFIWDSTYLDPYFWFEGPLDWSLDPDLTVGASWSYSGSITNWDAAKINDGILNVRAFTIPAGAASLIVDLGAAPPTYINRFRVDFTGAVDTTQVSVTQLLYSDDGSTWSNLSSGGNYKYFMTWGTDSFIDYAWPEGNESHRWYKIQFVNTTTAKDVSEVRFFRSSLSPVVGGWNIHEYVDPSGTPHIGKLLVTIPRASMPTKSRPVQFPGDPIVTFDPSTGLTEYERYVVVLAYNGTNPALTSPMSGIHWHFEQSYTVAETKATNSGQQGLHLEPQASPTVAPSGTASVVLDSADSKPKISISGSAYVQLATLSDIGGGVGPDSLFGWAGLSYPYNNASTTDVTISGATTWDEATYPDGVRRLRKLTINANQTLTITKSPFFLFCDEISVGAAAVIDASGYSGQGTQPTGQARGGRAATSGGTATGGSGGGILTIVCNKVTDAGSGALTIKANGGAGASTGTTQTGAQQAGQGAFSNNRPSNTSTNPEFWDGAVGTSGVVAPPDFGLYMGVGGAQTVVGGRGGGSGGTGTDQASGGSGIGAGGGGGAIAATAFNHAPTSWAVVMMALYGCLGGGGGAAVGSNTKAGGGGGGGAVVWRKAAGSNITPSLQATAGAGGGGGGGAGSAGVTYDTVLA